MSKSLNNKSNKYNIFNFFKIKGNIRNDPILIREYANIINNVINFTNSKQSIVNKYNYEQLRELQYIITGDKNTQIDFIIDNHKQKLILLLLTVLCFAFNFYLEKDKYKISRLIKFLFFLEESSVTGILTLNDDIYDNEIQRVLFEFIIYINKKDGKNIKIINNNTAQPARYNNNISSYTSPEELKKIKENRPFYSISNSNISIILKGMIYDNSKSNMGSKRPRPSSISPKDDGIKKDKK